MTPFNIVAALGSIFVVVFVVGCKESHEPPPPRTYNPPPPVEVEVIAEPEAEVEPPNEYDKWHHEQQVRERAAGLEKKE